MPYTPDQRYEMFQNLPQDVKEAIGSVEYIQTLSEIEKKYHLHLDQADKLSREIYELMLGITHPQEFVAKVARSLAVPAETAKQIAEEVNTKIFRPIRVSLMKIHEEVARAALEETTPVDSPIDEYSDSSLKSPTLPSVEPVDGPNIAEEKLKGAFVLPKKTSGYDGKDPYHESIG